MASYCAFAFALIQWCGAQLVISNNHSDSCLPDMPLLGFV